MSKKLCLVYHVGALYGGHLDYSNELVGGFRNAGYDVDYIWLTNAKTESRNTQFEEYLNSSNGVDDTGKTVYNFTYYKHLGCWGNVEKGFVLDKTSYSNIDQIERIRTRLDSYDIVMWQDVGNFNQKPLREEHSTNWLRLFKRNNHKTKQIAMVHEHIMETRYPFLANIIHLFDHVISVHPAAYNKSVKLNKKTFLIPNPQDISAMDTTHSNYDKLGNKELFSMGAWKSSKRFQDIVAAVPYIDSDAKIYMAGDGIERRYLATENEENMKENYVASRATDPDIDSSTLTENVIENGIWKRAHRVNPNFNYVGTLSKKQRDERYDNASLFLDPAWYRENFKIGAHFSRVIIEAMIHGVVPIGRNLGLSNNVEGNGEFFTAGKNYIMIPYDSTPKQFADIVNTSLGMSKSQYDTIVQTNYELVKDFAIENIISQFTHIFNEDYARLNLKLHTLDDSANNPDEELMQMGLDLLTSTSSKGFGISIDALQSLEKEGILKLNYTEPASLEDFF
jgi:hypothetical protein